MLNLWFISCLFSEMIFTPDYHMKQLPKIDTKEEQQKSCKFWDFLPTEPLKVLIEKSHLYVCDLDVLSPWSSCLILNFKLSFHFSTHFLRNIPSICKVISRETQITWSETLHNVITWQFILTTNDFENDLQLKLMLILIQFRGKFAFLWLDNLFFEFAALD